MTYSRRSSEKSSEVTERVDHINGTSGLIYSLSVNISQLCIYQRVDRNIQVLISVRSFQMAQIFFGVFSSLISASIDLTAFVSMGVLYNYVNFSYILFIHLSIWVGDGVVLHFSYFLIYYKYETRPLEYSFKMVEYSDFSQLITIKVTLCNPCSFL